MTAGLQYYVLDLETTGLSEKLHAITELSVIRCSDRFQLTRQVKVDPFKMKFISADALKITGKTIQDLKSGVEPLQLVEDFETFLNKDKLTPSHRVIVGHNVINFDRKFLHSLWKSQEKSFPADYFLDTVPFAKRLAAQMGQPKAKMKLDAAMDFFGLKKVANAHTAKGDSRATYHLWRHLMDKGVDYIDLIKPFPHNKPVDISDDDVNELMGELD